MQVTDYLHRSFLPIFNEPEGQAIWDFLQQPQNIIRVETAVYLGKSPLEALTPELLKLEIFQSNDEDQVKRFKQLTGSLVKYLLCHKIGGYELKPSKVNITSQDNRPLLFKTAATYKILKYNN
ncbi:hypothetical protein [Photobacterium sanguinicancri]|uniref:hypothetical protein n=1 Tax=Photobacterium sanguinicancri TaxID=875932 RepID=UPI0026E2223B|nr:hypothetical protein [Photobacterium sanguinicancri]MDO6500940.1 hypothetical protein [Photobacterium sanguinicancri]